MSLQQVKQVRRTLKATVSKGDMNRDKLTSGPVTAKLQREVCCTRVQMKQTHNQVKEREMT
jgi:hypothetical protein